MSTALLQQSEAQVFVAGRSLEKAEEYCRKHGGTPVSIDRTSLNLTDRIRDIAPDIVIDAAGPFQSPDSSPEYSVVHAALECGAHYVDLSDDAEFTAGIAQFDTVAKEKGLIIVSGASSVPGMSSAAVNDLSQGLERIIRIESTILPGNRAPRGRSVMQAILSQVGKPIEIQEAGQKAVVFGWSAPRLERLALPDGRSLNARWSTFIGAPDLRLFPDHFGAETVHFRAGLELKTLQFGLWMLSFLTRWKLVRSLRSLAAPLLWIAKRFEPFGSDQGGMIVRVLGETPSGQAEIRKWTLLAEAGDGPHIPTLPARILCDKILSGMLSAGARPCLSLFSTQEVMDSGKHLNLAAGRATEPAAPLFKHALGDLYDVLPEQVRALHDNLDVSVWSGTSSVGVGPSRLSAIVRKLIGFPSKGSSVPVTVHMKRSGDREIWTRRFGDQVFHSILKLWGSPKSGTVTERFGPFRFVIDLQASDANLEYPITKGWAFGIPLPKWMLPKSQTQETQADGRFQFDVAIGLPLVGLLVHYKGHLQPHEKARQTK